MTYHTQFDLDDTVQDTGRPTKPFVITDIRIVKWIDPDDKKTRAYAEYRNTTRVNGKLRQTPWVAEKYLEPYMLGCNPKLQRES